MRRVLSSIHFSRARSGATFACSDSSAERFQRVSAAQWTTVCQGTRSASGGSSVPMRHAN